MARYVGAWFVGILMFGDMVGELTGRASAGGSPADQTVVPLADGFEDDARFTSRCAAQKCTSFWTRDTLAVRTGTFAFHGADVPTASDKSLLPFNALIIPANASAATLTFWHRFDFEHTEPGNFFDGGVLEASTDDGQSWFDLGASITAGGYNGTIADIPTGNTLAGRAGWVGSIDDFQQVAVDLRPYRGQSFTFRLRMGTDSSNLTKPLGWSVDDVQVSYQAPLASCTRSWSTVSQYPIGIVAAAAAGLGGDVYVFGGETFNGATAKAYKYVAGSDEWTAIAALPEPRTGASAVTDGTYIYVFGGAVGDQVTATLWRYDPTANNYATLTPLNFAVAYHGAAFIPHASGGFIYRIGGTIDAVHTNYAIAIASYSIGSGIWGTNQSGHPDPVGRLAVLGLDGYVFTAGGATESGASLKTYRYDQQNDLWEDEQIADLPTAASTTGAFYKGTWLLSADGTALGWDPGTNRWRSFDQIPRFVGGATAAAAGDAFYLIGGVAGMAPVTTVQKYIETDCALPTPTATPPPGPTDTVVPRSPTSTPPGGSACIGDCGGDGTVGVSELVRGVSIALGLQPLDGCPTFDGNRDGMVAVNELVAAVNNALLGCS